MKSEQQKRGGRSPRIRGAGWHFNWRIGPRILVVVGLAVLAGGCAGSAVSTDPGSTQTGMASYYGEEFAGEPTASGETFDPSAMTAAHRTLPFGTQVRVTRLSTGEAITVRVNDRGPWIEGRIIDLARAAAEELNMIEEGVVEVEIEVVE